MDTSTSWRSACVVRAVKPHDTTVIKRFLSTVIKRFLSRISEKGANLTNVNILLGRDGLKHISLETHTYRNTHTLICYLLTHKHSYSNLL